MPTSVAVFLASLLAFAAVAAADMPRRMLQIETAVGALTLDVEIAATPSDQARGLMFRRSLGDKQGMLFLYTPAQPVQMWMANTYLPLDMVFIRADGRVHRIERNTEPFSRAVISSEGTVAAVLEIKGGFARRLGIRPGDLVRHPHFGTE